MAGLISTAAPVSAPKPSGFSRFFMQRKFAKAINVKAISAQAVAAESTLESEPASFVPDAVPTPAPLAIKNESSLLIPFLLQSHKHPHVLICPVKRNGKLLLS
jgi:hypothetical protein